MSHSHNILPECETDTLLVEILGFPKPQHQRGISEVFKVFQKTENKGFLVIGVVDMDKRMPKGFEDFEQIGESGRLLKFKSKLVPRHFLITHPNLETWLFDIEAPSVQLDTSRFTFNSKAYFKEVTKSKDARNNKNLRQFLNALKQKQAPGLTTLAQWLTELSEK